MERSDTPIASPFDAGSTAAEVIAGVDLDGRRALVTGGSSGIGIETARALAGAGAEVTLAVRDTQAGLRIAQELAATGGPRPRVGHLDLADPGSVGSFVADWDGPLHLLINNAGVMAPPEQRTAAGWELQFATNHLGHFALANGLHRALAAAGGARIVSLSSRAHLRAPVVFEDINFERRDYDRWTAYAQSKTANVLFAVGASERWRGEGILANAVMPGVVDTNLMRHVSDEDFRAIFGGKAPPFKTPQEGAATSVFVATSPLLEGVGGRYFENCNEAAVAKSGLDGGVADFALDPDAAARLWRISELAVAPTGLAG